MINEHHLCHLGVGTNRTSALCAGVGTEFVKALGAHMLLILLHVLLPVQVVTAVVAVEPVGHGGAEITPGTCEKHARHRGVFPLNTRWGQCCLFWPSQNMNNKKSRQKMNSWFLQHVVKAQRKSTNDTIRSWKNSITIMNGLWWMMFYYPASNPLNMCGS